MIPYNIDIFLSLVNQRNTHHSALDISRSLNVSLLFSSLSLCLCQRNNLHDCTTSCFFSPFLSTLHVFSVHSLVGIELV